MYVFRQSNDVTMFSRRNLIPWVCCKYRAAERNLSRFSRKILHSCDTLCVWKLYPKDLWYVSFKSNLWIFFNASLSLRKQPLNKNWSKIPVPTDIKKSTFFKFLLLLGFKMDIFSWLPIEYYFKTSNGLLWGRRGQICFH